MLMLSSWELPWRLFRCSLGIPWELLGNLWELSGVPRGFWVLLGCSLGVCCVPWGRLGASWELLRFLGAVLGWMWGGLSRLASIGSALLGVPGGEMLQNVAVALGKARVS